ncbi:MAG TPA: glycosyltransferase family 39 protein [Deltaproteobacteria bacterium]|nr:glycosyltransferase family 39 protein [Deltaproteobacteria bacterium]HOI08377.1 glycosyltransferase family 39 protein [Deltaproteobacteria bacterium]
MGRSRLPVPLWVVFWAVLVPVSLLSRPYLPLDETRYVSVAWDMWLNGDFLVPRLNGALYSEKPPLLFWLYHLGWSVLGVNDLWPRTVSPLSGAAVLLLTSRLARRLWPDRPLAARTAPLILMGSLLWTIFLSTALFDMLLAFFTLAGVFGIVRSWQDRGPTGWLVLGAAIGLGILAKGPVILLHTLPLALLAPWWAVERRPVSWTAWYAGIASASALGILIALAWAVPAALRGGEEYAEAIFWGQSAGRMVRSFAHEHPFWWYLPLLPAMLFPWSLWPALWRGFASLARRPRSGGVRLCLAWIVPVLAIFSLISGKQVHYLLPAFPGFALIASRALDGSRRFLPKDPLAPAVVISLVGLVLLMPGLFPFPPNLRELLGEVNPYCGMALAAAGPILYFLYSQGPPDAALRITLVSGSSVLLAAMLVTGLAGVFRLYDMRGISSYIAGVQRREEAVCYVGTYHGVFNFLGRLEKPLDVIQEDQVLLWAACHPDGCIVADEKHLGPVPGLKPDYETPWGHHTFRLWKGSSVAGVHRQGHDPGPASSGP